MLSVIQGEVVARHAWLTASEFTDIVAVSQVTPGPIGINCATYVGYTATGSVLGSALASAAIVIPSLVIMLLICKAYFVVKTRFQHSVYFTNTMRMLRIAVLGLIAAAALCLMTPISFIDWRSWVIFAVVCCFTLLPTLIKSDVKWLKPLINILSHPIILILLAGVAGYIIY